MFMLDEIKNNEMSIAKKSNIVSSVEQRIIIDNLMGIKHLDFKLPDIPGVYLIVGENGSGKTTLLSCIDRIKNQYSFFSNFLKAKGNNTDLFNNTKIEYVSQSGKVQFFKGEGRWSSKPKKNSDVLNGFGYEYSLFLKADNNRIGIKKYYPESIKPVKAQQELISALNEIFDTKKYEQLHCKHDGEDYIYLLKDDGETYYSEWRFSTGEIACIRLIQSILNRKEKRGIILLDEAEMALHPKVQKNLIEYLKKEVANSQVTIFVSTHSPIIINAIEKENIFLLINDEKTRETKAENPCYQARAIGTLVNIGTQPYDFVFLVEDEMAYMILKRMIERYIKNNNLHIEYCILPVGGYDAVAKMAVNFNLNRQFNNLLSKNGKAVAFLDGDVKKNNLDKSNNDYNESFDILYEKYKKYICFLDFTPEIRIIEYCESQNKNSKLKNIVSGEDYNKINAKNEREQAKKKLNHVINYYKNSLQDHDNDVKNQIINNMVEEMKCGEINHYFDNLFNYNSI